MSYAIVAHDSYSAIDLPASPPIRDLMLLPPLGFRVKTILKFLLNSVEHLAINDASQWSN